jgi:hypothetical protein
MRLKNRGVSNSIPLLDNGGPGSGRYPKGSHTEAKNLSELVARAETEGGAIQSWHNYSTGDAKQAARLKTATGLDLHDYQHRIESSAVRKILSDHGADPIPVTKSDFEKLPQIVSDPDQILMSPALTKQGLRAITYQKKFDGSILVVEEIRTGKNKLALKTMYKRPS